MLNPASPGGILDLLSLPILPLFFKLLPREDAWSLTSRRLADGIRKRTTSSGR